jgi:hypothetical protein
MQQLSVDQTFFKHFCKVLLTAPIFLSGCTLLHTSDEISLATRPLAPAGPSASGVPPGTPQPSGPPPSSLQTFGAVVRDAKKIDGLFTLYQRDERVWIELKPEDFNKPFFLSPKLATGIGEGRLFGGLMDEERVIEFRRVHNQVQMIARNTGFVARSGTPEGHAVELGFSPSLLASTPVASQAQPERKSVLIDANSLFVNDMLGIAMHLQRTYRQGYGFDARNSAITNLRVKPEGVTLQVLAHFATGSINPPQLGGPGATVPSAVPDPRSLFVTLHYALLPLPEEPMRSRAADARLGHFAATQWDFSDDLSRSPVLRHVHRWRLEKKEPDAALSEPIKPIVYWLDRTIPLKYRDAISAGVLEWNKAFERIGYKNAIQTKVPPADADFDTLDSGASVRWMTNAQPSFGAIGPSHVDPRSGEILGATIGIESLSARSLRTARAQILNNTAADWAQLTQTSTAADAVSAGFDKRVCHNADHAAEQLSYALDVLSARGDIDPSGPEAQQFVLDYLKDTAMHEVGHTLGLRHNFRASGIYAEAQLSDPVFTRNHALGGSVMEYSPINLASPGGKLVAPFQTTLGPYDYWAIEYAYKSIDAKHERQELARIAARSTEPELAYGTDEDNYLGIEPDALQFDLGNDPLVFARKRLSIARDLFKRQESRLLLADQDYAVLRRSLGFAVNDAARAVGVLARQISGVRNLRDAPGSGRDPVQPVATSVQRDALDQIGRSLFAADSFVITPALQRRLAPDFQERADALERGSLAAATDFALTQRVLALQRVLLSHLMGDAVAARIIDNKSTGMPSNALQNTTRNTSPAASKRADNFTLSELYSRLERDIWSELPTGTEIASARRELQREHLSRLTERLLRPGNSPRADVRSLTHAQARVLLARVNTATKRLWVSAETKAHLQECADALTQALSARVIKFGV